MMETKTPKKAILLVKSVFNLMEKNNMYYKHALFIIIILY